MIPINQSKYWDQFYSSQDKIGWDIGYCSTPIKEYIDQIEDKSLRILVPGAGNGYEVEYLFNNGFSNTYLLDFAPSAIDGFLKRNPEFPSDHIFCQDFFSHNFKYDLIIEQTFFSSFPKVFRSNYTCKMHSLLNEYGKLVGLLFNHEFEKDIPPFGGSIVEYQFLFRPYFNFMYFETAYNSIKPRKDREIFMLLIKKDVLCPFKPKVL